MTPGKTPFHEPWLRWLIWSLASCLVTIAALVTLHVFRNVFRPAPLVFSAEVYLPARTDLCPGDTVEWRPRLTVRRAPTLLVVVRTLWTVGDQRTLVPDTQPEFYVWNAQEEGQPISRLARYTLPRDLQVGLYEIRAAATAFNSDAASYRVPVVIAESCFKKGAP